MPRSAVGKTTKRKGSGYPMGAATGRAGTEDVSFSRREVADIAGVSLQAIDKAIEQGVLPRRRRQNETVIGKDGLVVMTILSQANVELPVKVKQLIRRWVTSDKPYAASGSPELKVSDVISVFISPQVRERIDKAEEYALGRERYIMSDPEIFGREPVIAGTRIRAESVAKRIEMGDTIDMLVEDYPYVDPKAFEIAARFAKTHPRRGRPAKPWREDEAGRTRRA